MPVSDDTKYAETMSTIRHYSALRFAMLTIFMAVTGALASALLDEEIQKQFRYEVARWAGFWVAVCFLVFELALNGYLSKLWDRADALIGTSSDGFRPLWKRRFVGIAAGSISAGVGLFWVVLPSLLSGPR